MFEETEEDIPDKTKCSEAMDILKSIDISRITPIAALNKLYELQEMLK